MSTEMPEARGVRGVVPPQASTEMPEARGVRGVVPPQASTDRICLTGLRAFGRHGALPHERAIGQEFVVDAVLWLDTRAAAAADDLARTVDYGALSSRLAEIISGEPVALIETLAERLAAACLDNRLVSDVEITDVEITVHKPHAPVSVLLDDVSVVIRRCRQ